MDAKYLIIGAGVTGLSFARYIEDDYILIEKENEIGGLCRTVNSGEFVWDYGGHFFHFKSDLIRNDFNDFLMDESIIQNNKVSNIFFKNRLIDYPFQLNINQLEKKDFIKCLLDLYFREPENITESFQDMLYSKFGKSIAEFFLIPYNEKLYSCELSKLDVDAMGRFFPYVEFDDVMNNIKNKKGIVSYNDEFFYSSKGARLIVDYLNSYVDNSRIHTDEKVIDIDLNNKKLKTEQNEYSYEYLINTISLPSFGLLSKLNCSHIYFGWSKVLVFNIGLKHYSKDRKTHWTYFPQKEMGFYRVGYYNNIVGHGKQSMYVEKSFKKECIIDVEQEWKTMIEQLERVGAIESDGIEDSCYMIIDPAYVHVNGKSCTAVSKMLLDLEINHQAFSIGRYGGWKYCSIEDCILEARMLANKLNNPD